MGIKGVRRVFGIIGVLALTAGVAGAWDYSPNANNWGSSTFGPNPTFEEARLANQATGELYADVMLGSVSIQREFRRALPSIYSYTQTAHYQNRADIGSDAAYADVAASGSVTSESICPTTMCSPGSNWVMWDVPWMQNETRKMDDGFMGYRSASSGFATGISRLIGESSAIGLAVGYDARKIDARDHYHQRNRADALHLALYGGTNIGRLFIDGYAGWSRAWNRAERTVEGQNVIGGDAVLKSNYNDDVFSAGIKASYVWILGNDVRVTPSIGVDFSHLKLQGFDERTHFDTVGGLALRGHDSSYTNVAVPVMVSVNKTFGSDFLAFKGAQSLWTPEVHAGWTPQFGSKNAAAKLSNPGNGIPGGANRIVNTLSNTRASSYGTVGAGLKIKLADKFIFAVEYDYTFAGKYANHSVTGMYGVSF